MHEFSIAQSVVAVACEEADRAGASRVLKVGLEVGVLSGVVPESLEFCFPVACRQTKAEGAVLEIRLESAHGQCPSCGAEFSVQDLLFACPECGAFPVQLTSGRSLKVLFVEVE